MTIDTIMSAAPVTPVLVLDTNIESVCLAQVLVAGLPVLEITLRTPQPLDAIRAEALGGVAALAALGGQFGDIRLCPTGGIASDSAPLWLGHSSVRCVGGSWSVKADDRDLTEIGKRARVAAALAPCSTKVSIR